MLQNLGRVGWVFEGEWVAGSYKPLSVVRTGDGALWVSNTATSSEPGTDNTWTLAFPSPVSVMGYSSSFMADGSQFIKSNGQYGLTIAKGTYIRLGSGSNAYHYYTNDDVVITDARSLLDTGAAFQAGKDYYVYLCKTDANSDFQLKISMNTTFPTGMTADNSRKIGGFHTLCVAAGTLPNFDWGGQSVAHPLSGFSATAILPQSVWDLKNRATCENEGMVKSSLLPLWTDIYLYSGTGYATRSAYGGAITRSRAYHLMVEEDLPSVGKRPLFSIEFTCMSRGSNEQTSCAGANEAGATTGGAGGRVDTAGRRMLSADGCEEMTGSLWQTLADQSAAGQHTNSADTYFYGLMDNGSQGNIVGQTDPHVQQGDRGKFWHMCTVLIAGANWGDGVGCGSSSRFGYSARSRVSTTVGSRGCASSRVA